jgi:hypothetical protein
VSYVLRIAVREAEPYTGLQDEEEVREAVRQEVATTVNELGSDILEEGTDEERERVAEDLTDRAMDYLWTVPLPRDHRLPGGRNQRNQGVLLTLDYEEDQT